MEEHAEAVRGGSSDAQTLHYAPEWGERPDVHADALGSPTEEEALEFDSIATSSWGRHGAVPLMRAVGRVLNEMHRPVEVYKEASRALLNLMAANAESDGFTRYHDYLEPLAVASQEAPGPLERQLSIVSPKEEKAVTASDRSPAAAIVAAAAAAEERRQAEADSQPEPEPGSEPQAEGLEPEPEPEPEEEQEQEEEEERLFFDICGWWHGEAYFNSGNSHTQRTFCVRPVTRDSADDSDSDASDAGAAAAGTHPVELEGEGWDDTGPFRIEGALRHDGVSDERYFSLDAVYIRAQQAAGDYRSNASSVIRQTLFVSPAHANQRSASECQPTVAWGVWEQHTGSTMMTTKSRSRGVVRFTRRPESEALQLGAQQHNIF